MTTVRKLRDEEDMDMDEAIRTGVSMRKQLLYRMIDIPPKGFYSGDEEEMEN